LESSLERSKNYEACDSNDRPSRVLALGGCSSSEPSAAQQASMAKTELHFDLNACQQIEPGLYKCPAADKAICSPDYNGQAECVRIGPKGGVFVQSGFAN